MNEQTPPERLQPFEPLTPQGSDLVWQELTVEHEHRWVFLRQEERSTEASELAGGNELRDIFFCSECLEYSAVLVRDEWGNRTAY